MLDAFRSDTSSLNAGRGIIWGRMDDVQRGLVRRRVNNFRNSRYLQQTSRRLQWCTVVGTLRLLTKRHRLVCVVFLLCRCMSRKCAVTSVVRYLGITWRAINRLASFRRAQSRVSGLKYSGDRCAAGRGKNSLDGWQSSRERRRD